MQAVRTVNRGPNPFSPLAKLRNRNLSAGNTYVHIQARIEQAANDPGVQGAIAAHRERLGGQQLTQEHFGRLELIPVHLIDFNVDIQRELELPHIANNIITNFDPRIMQPIMCTYIKSTGRYSCWEGQQSGTSVALMIAFGLVDPTVQIQAKVFDDDLTVPGSSLVGEAVANFGFRTLNGAGRKGVDEFTKHRSRFNGVRKYGSMLAEDIQSHRIQERLEAANMFPAPAHQAAGRQAQPGMVTHISALNQIANFGSDQNTFDLGLEDLAWALQWHDRFYAHEKGVDGGFILAFGRLHAASRGDAGTANQLKIDSVPITPELELELANMIREKFLTPHGWHEHCKERLRKWQTKENLRVSWSDSCLTPFLVLDYLDWGGTQAIPLPRGLKMYEGI